MTFTDVLTIPEGQIFWAFSGPSSGSRHIDITETKHPLGHDETLEPRPALLFIHAAVTDHTLWDNQAAFFTTRGWTCIRYDLFGYGKSTPSNEYLHAQPRVAIKHHEHTLRVTQAYLNCKTCDPLGEKFNEEFIVMGLSFGAEIALDFVLTNAHLVHGLVLCAGGVGGLEFPNTEDEDSLFQIYKTYMDKREIEAATEMNVRIWGDGTQSPAGRLDPDIRRQLSSWCKTIAGREVRGIGGSTIPCEGFLGQGTAAQTLHLVKVPTLVATGRYDESSTTAAMRHVAKELGSQASLKEFETAHMINLENVLEFNEWLEHFLKQFIHGGTP